MNINIKFIYVAILFVVIYLLYKNFYPKYFYLKYWIGPYGIRVPIHIDKIIARDGCNILYREGGETQLLCNPEMSKDEYIKKYAVYKDGYYYWKK